MNNPFCRRFENQLEVGELKLEWTTRASDLVLRPFEADESIVWFLLKRADYGPELLHRNRMVSFIVFPDIRLQQAINGRQFWRYWQLPSGEDCFLRKNYGLFRTTSAELVRFNFPRAFVNFADAKGEEIEQFLRELEAPGSDLEAAKAWSKLPERERVWRYLRLRGGRASELEELLRAALVLADTSHARFTFNIPLPGPVAWKHLNWWRGSRINQFLDILDVHFPLNRDAQDWRGHDAFGDPMDVPYPVFNSTEPTQHERLEALLLWRDFLRGKIPDAQIESLLRPVST